MDNNYSPFVSPSGKENQALSELTKTLLRSELSSDSIIPDTIADVENILLSTATPRIEEKTVRDNTLEIEGNIIFEILLATENNTLSSLTLTEPFSLKQTIEGLNEDCHLMMFPTVNYVATKLLNPRKINLRSQIDIPLHVFCPRSLQTDVIGTESLDDDMNLQRSLSTFISADMAVHEENLIPASYDIELDSSSPPAAEIVSTRLCLHPLEVRRRNDEADLRIGAFVSVIYRTEEGNYFTADKNFMLEKTLTDAIPERCEWSASAIPGEISAEIASNSYGEMKIIEIDFNYDLLLNTINNKNITLVNDMYSTEFECESKRMALDISRLHRVYSSGLTVNSSVLRENVNGEKLRSVFGGSVLLKEETVTYLEDKGKLLIEGNAKIDLIGENNIFDENDRLFTPLHYEYPFRCEIDSGEDLQNSNFIVSSSVNDIKFRTDSSHIYTDFEITTRVIVLDQATAEHVEELRLDRTSPVNRSVAPITLCYPSGRESLWDIAKYYKITTDQILSANNLSNADIDGKRVLLIPRSEPKRPVFSKVI